MHTQALVVTAADRVEVRELELPEPGPGQVLVESWYSCVSPGTELRVMSGSMPATAFPFAPGYATVGRVIAAGAGADLAAGSVVFGGGSEVTAPYHRCWGGHVGHAVGDGGGWITVPDGVDPGHAALTKLGAIAWHGIRLAGIRPADRVTVVGLGVLGQLSARLAAATGAAVVACDVDTSRVEPARAAGLDARLSGSSLDDTFADDYPDGFDVVVDVTGAAPVLPQAVELLRQTPWGRDDATGPRYVVQGSYPGTFAVPYRQLFQREAALLVPRDNQPRDRVAFLDHLAAGRLDVSNLVSAVVTPDRAAEVYRRLRDRDGGLMTALFDWRSGRSHP